MDDRARKLSELLHEAGEVHHLVWRKENGDDPDWASWYADWLVTHTELADLLGARPVRSYLTYELVRLDREFTETSPGGTWEDHYARGLLETLGS